MAAHPMLNSLKQWLGFNGDNNDTKLELILYAIDEVLYEQESICVQPKVITSSINGSGNNILVLPKVPLRSLTSISIDGTAVDLTTVKQKNTFMLLAEDTFTAGVGNVEIVYESGFTTIPKNIQLLYCMLGEKIFKKNVNAAPNVSAASSDFGRVTFVVAESLITKEMQALLVGYSMPVV
jgi:hypothetical protein